jgi:hypothetical protein
METLPFWRCLRLTAMQLLFLKVISLFLGFAIGNFPEVKIQTENFKGKMLKIELGQTFRNDHVKVYLDKKLVYSKQITSSDSALITDVFEVTKPKMPFTIMVEVNGEKFEKSSPKQEKELDKEDYSLLVNYNRETEEVEIKTKIVIVLYD